MAGIPPRYGNLFACTMRPNKVFSDGHTTISSNSPPGVPAADTVCETNTRSCCAYNLPSMLCASSAPAPPAGAFLPSDMTTNGALDVSVAADGEHAVAVPAAIPGFVEQTVINFDGDKVGGYWEVKQSIVAALMPEAVVNG